MAKQGNGETARKRADVVLVERGLFESRARARAAIDAGLVVANDVRVARSLVQIAIGHVGAVVLIFANDA